MVGIFGVGERNVRWGSRDSSGIEPTYQFSGIRVMRRMALTGTCMKPYTVVQLFLSLVQVSHFRSAKVSLKEEQLCDLPVNELLEFDCRSDQLCSSVLLTLSLAQSPLVNIEITNVRYNPTSVPHISSIIPPLAQPTILLFRPLLQSPLKGLRQFRAQEIIDDLL